jgi:hypothetical protein
MRRPTALLMPDRGTGRHKAMRQIADVGRRDSAIHHPIVRLAQAKRAGPRMQTGRRGRVLEARLRAGIHDPTRPQTTAIGRPRHRQATGPPLRRQMAAVATRIAVPRMGTAPISRPHDRVRRPEAITRTPLRTMAVAAGLISRRRGRIRLRPRGLTRHRAIVTPHLAAVTPRPAVATAAEVAAVEVEAAVVAAARTEVAAEVRRTAAEGAPTAAAVRTEADRTDIKNCQQRPALELGRAFSFAPRNAL